MVLLSAHNSPTRLTKPLSFADCVGDELPWGWEAAYDHQIGVYYIDHINQTTQIEDPRKQWRQEQEKMLKDYLTVAQDALSTKKELFHVKEQRLALALGEYVRLNDVYKEKSSSYTSLFSSSSSSTKYDPDILKAEISTIRLRVKKLKRELLQMKQELLYKEQGYETLQQIDQKMSGGQNGYELSEAKAIMNELKSIQKAISSGEKEKQDLMKSLVKLRERFLLGQNIAQSESDLRCSLAHSQQSLSKQTLDAGSQTDISGDVSVKNMANLAEKVRLSLQYEEAKRRMANLKIELSKLKSEAWPGALEIEKEKLMLINEKEELLKELQFVTSCKRTQDELKHLEAERKRLEEELSMKSTPSDELTERLKLEDTKNKLVKKLEETSHLTTHLHSQLKSLSASTLSVSSGSSLGSLASSRGSLNTSSRGSLNSLNSTDLYYSQVNDKYRNESISQSISHSRNTGVDFSRRTRTHLLDEKTGCVSAAVSDESVAGDSGVYEASVQQPNKNEEVAYTENDTTMLETAQVQIGLRYDTKSSGFVIVIMQLQNLQALSIYPGNKIYFRLALLPPSTDISCLFRTKFHPATEPLLFSEMFRTVISQAALQKKTLRVDICSVSKSHQEECLGGIQISLGDVSFSNEISTLWYNLLSSKQTVGERNTKPKKYSVFVAANPTPVSLDAVSALLERTTAELQAVEQELAEKEEEGEEEEEDEEAQETQETQSLEEDWIGILAEVSREMNEENKIKETEEDKCTDSKRMSFNLEQASSTDHEKDTNLTEVDLNKEIMSPVLVDRETNTEDRIECVAIRPKDKASLKTQQHPFVRNSMIVRSQTFSPGERNQYICRLNRSDSDSSTLAKRTLFVRNSTERQSLRIKRPTCQSNLQRAMRQRLVRTSLDLELDLQASRTRQSRLNDELRTLRALRQKLEEMKASEQTNLPPCILEDERFQKLLKQAEKEAEQSKDKKKQGLNAEKLMRKASKDVCWLREQSQKVPLQVQSFREKMAYFTRAKISIPALPADDV
ncbi:protein WWC2 [Crotalus adamanteus]|uniref:Protein WWC2 n=1 Tax=Crotalus adamanteus TaxID=8729 RepID=A0AAW1BA80_CROAD